MWYTNQMVREHEGLKPPILDENEIMLCSGYMSQTVLAIIASRWTVLVMNALQSDTRRYSELTKILKGITQKVLTETLRKLERDGIVERKVYPVVPPRTEYKLTPLGLSLLEATDRMAQWAVRHSDEVASAREAYDTSHK